MIFPRAYINGGGRGVLFIVSTEGLLWGIESAQNFDSGDTRQQSARKA